MRAVSHHLLTTTVGCGASSFLLGRKSRTVLGLYIISRACFIFNDVCEKKKLVPKINHLDIAFMCVFGITMGYLSTQPDLSMYPPFMDIFNHKFANLKRNEWIVYDCYRQLPARWDSMINRG